jgi:phosphoribosylglycinamide formyltransferase-1
MAEATTPLPVAVLISGDGSNLQAIIDARQRGELPIELCAVISNRPDAFGLERARRAGIPAHVLDHTQYPSREAFDQALQTLIDASGARLVVLAGFMRILTPAFVRHYEGRMLNIHPSLLPKYRGLDTHARAIAAGDAEHGASVHFVTTELDSGPTIVQVRVPIRADDTPQSLGDRVRAQEHIIYPLAIRWFAEGRLQWKDGRAFLDGQPLTGPRQLRP